jgi:fucose 4-O-acetylase-like acetyltransferase
LYISKVISKRYKANVLLYIGRNTISIMALQFISFKIVAIIQIYIYRYPLYYLAKFPVISGNNGWWILYSIVGVIVPIFIKYICKMVHNILRRVKKYV